MASSIDATIPADDTAVAKSDMRSNFSAAKTEIEDLQKEVALPRRIAFGELNMKDLV